MATDSVTAVLHNLTDGEIALPPLPALDGKVVILGAAMDKDVAGRAQPSLPVTTAQRKALLANKVFKALYDQRPKVIEFRSPNLDIVEGA